MSGIELIEVFFGKSVGQLISSVPRIPRFDSFILFEVLKYMIFYYAGIFSKGTLSPANHIYIADRKYMEH